MMTRDTAKMRASVPALVVALMLAGCAGSTPEPVAIQPFAKAERPLEGYSHMIMTCEAKRGVEIPEQEQQRVVALVKQEMKRRAPGRFVFVKEGEQMSEAVPTSQEPDMKKPKTALMHILFIEYDEGSAFARFMIAGAGQIHIDTNVTLRDEATNELLGQYEVSKQFAFGGVYGATTDVEDVEEGLAKGIADILAPDTPEAEQGKS